MNYDMIIYVVEGVLIQQNEYLFKKFSKNFLTAFERNVRFK